MMRELESETSFLTGPNAAFIVELYARYAKDPQSVEPGWRSYFASLGEDAAEALADLRGASWAPPRPQIMNGSLAANGNQAAGTQAAGTRAGNGALAAVPAPATAEASFAELKAT